MLNIGTSNVVAPCRGFTRCARRRVLPLREGLVKYTAAGLLEKNESGIGQNLSDLLDEGCANELVGAGSRSDRYRSASKKYCRSKLAR